MANWRPAESPVQLQSEANVVALNRSKTADGAIGDQAHAGRRSRHNPNSAGGLRSYTGANPHTGYIHVAVGLGTDVAPRPPYDARLRGA
jgi:hypothetical protein